jgi:hypothetical protein
MIVIYVNAHDCNPRVEDKKPDKENVQDYLKIRPTSTTKQIQIDKVREALLCGKTMEEVEDVADKYSNQRHLQYLKTSIAKNTIAGKSDLDAIRSLKGDFSKRNLDENLIMDVTENYVILSSLEKIRLAALITLGKVTEPVSLDGCESIVKDFTEVEMTTYFPLLRRNVKLVSLFAPKPGENSGNVAKMVQTFDAAVNKMLPSVAEEHGVDPSEFANRGLDPQSYVGDEGGALWKGLCMVKGNEVKNKTISDVFHIKQDVRRHCKHFKTTRDQNKFKKIMEDASNAATSFQAKEAEQELEKLIKNRSTNVSKMLNFKKWWWRRRIRWQKWCRAASTSNASTAEVANSQSISCSGYRKRLLDVVTNECSAAVLEAAEMKRQRCGLKTIGKGPTAADRLEKEEVTLFLDRERSASAVQYVAENADVADNQLYDIEMAEYEYNVNTKDTHRADKLKKNSQKQVKSRNNSVSKTKLKFFEKYVKDVTMDIVDLKSHVSQFNFKLLDTMRYIQDLKISKDSVTCSSPVLCTDMCHHRTWILHKIFDFDKTEAFIYKKHFSTNASKDEQPLPCKRMQFKPRCKMCYM